MRLFHIIVVATALSLPNAASAADDASVPTKVVDTLNKIWGVHKGIRANHAKGRVFEGTFTPTPEAASLSTASLFKSATPITVRFSDSGGITLPDGAAPANPHGMSIKFHLADGSDVDIVANSLPFSPVTSGEQFLELLQAVAASPPQAPKPTKLDEFFAAHPVAKQALTTPQTPSSFARESYRGIDTFIFVDANGKRQPFRYLITPAAGSNHLSKDEAAKQPPNFLMDEITARVTKGPVLFALKAQLAKPGDPIDDPTKAWPKDRETVAIGVLKIDKVDPDSAKTERQLLFLPTNLTDGIEASNDPLISSRTQAYGVSYSRRATP
jgi:catalase